MRLQYKILWFDDQPDSATNMKEGLANRLSRLGFQLEVEWHKEIKEEGSFLAQLQRRGDIDLILMDWNMGAKAPSGAVLARKLRSKVHTEIVFYSSASQAELRKAIFDQDIDGVYCVRRETLVNEAMHVIRTTIKKVLDLNHMRGLFMGTVSDYDAQIDEMMALVCKRMNDNSGMLKYIRKLVIDANTSHSKQIEKLDLKENIDELLGHRGFTSFLKYRVLCALLGRRADDRAIVDVLPRLKDYDDQIIKPRNALAHAKATEEEGRITFKGRGLEFNEETLVLLRKNLLAHGDNLTDIRRAIEAGIFDDVTDLG